MGIVETVGRIAGLSLLDWRYLAIAVKELLIARVRHATQPTGRILCKLQEVRSPPSDPPASIEVTRLAWAIGVIAARVPWRSDCLVKVMAADRWLRRGRFCPEFFLGVGKNPTYGIMAHAWLRCNGIVVTGAFSDQYTLLMGPQERQSKQALR